MIDYYLIIYTTLQEKCINNITNIWGLQVGEIFPDCNKSKIYVIKSQSEIINVNVFNINEFSKVNVMKRLYNKFVKSCQ